MVPKVQHHTPQETSQAGGVQACPQQQVSSSAGDAGRREHQREIENNKGSSDHCLPGSFGPQKTNYKEWISADSLKKIQTRKKKKVALNNGRTRAEKARAQ